MATNPLTAALGELGGATVEAAAFAGGIAVGPILKPALQELENEVWKEAVALGVVRPLAAETAAEVAAEDVDKYPNMETEASFTGFDATRFANLYGVTLNAPGVGTLIELLRRSAEVPIDFQHGLRKAKLEDQWDAALGNLAAARLTPAQLALGIVRSVVDDPGLQVGANDTTGGLVPAYPVSAIDTLQEAGFSGIDRERLRVMVGEIGLPMSLQQAASAYFRKIIELPDFYKAVAQGDTRPAWGPFILDQARQILSPNQYTERQLRGFTDRNGRLADTAKSGMTVEDSDKLFQILGRAPSVHALTVGLARGGAYPGSYANIPEPYRSAIQRSNIREEFAEIVYAGRFGYPSGFQIRSEAQKGDLTTAETEEILLELGWSPKWAKFFARKWAPAAADGGKEATKGELLDEFEGGFITESELRDHLTALGYTGATQDLEVHLADARRIKGWRDKGITALGKRYIASTMDTTAADTYLQELGVTDPDTRGRIIGIWNIEREFK